MLLGNEISTIHPLTLESCANPVIDRRGYQANNLSSLRLLSKYEDRLRTSAFPGGSQILDFSKDDFIQEQMIGQYRQITALLSDNLRGCILDDAGTMYPWLLFGSYKVLECLADSPHA